MKRVVHKVMNFADAEKWDVRQQAAMSPGERQRIAKELRERVYGKNPPDVRQSTRLKGSG